MSDEAQAPVYEAIDRVMAPFVCNQIVDLRSVFVKFGQYLGGRSDAQQIKAAIPCSNFCSKHPYPPPW